MIRSTFPSYPFAGALSLVCLLFSSALMAQGDCDNEDPLNDAPRWGMYITQPAEGEAETEFFNVDDPDAVCGSAIAFRITAPQPDFFNGGFFYGHEENLLVLPGEVYRVSFRYRAPRARPLYWRIITRPVGTFGSEDIGLAERTLPVTTTYQTYTYELTIPETLTEDHSLFFLGMHAKDTTSVYIDDFKLENITPEPCDEGPLNDVSQWGQYTGSGSAQEIGVVQDPDAVCGDAIYAQLTELESSPFDAGVGIDREAAFRFKEDSLYQIKFRYRADAPRLLYYRVLARDPSNLSGPATEIFAQDIVATEEYQQFDRIVDNTTGAEKILAQLWINGDDLTRFYIDDLSVVGVPRNEENEDCLNEDPFFNDVNNYLTYGGATLEEAKDEPNAICNDAFVIDPSAAADGGTFSAGFEITQEAAFDDIRGGAYSVSFRYRSESARMIPLVITSRKRGTYGTDDGPRYFFLNLASTPTYQRATIPLESNLPAGELNRILHMQLGVGGDASKIYLDNFELEFTPPPPPGDPTVFYVRKTGDDANSGAAPNEPFLTIGRGLQELTAGDTLIIGDGTYDEQDLVISGLEATADKPTLIQSGSPWEAKLGGGGDDSQKLLVENSSHLIVDGLEVFGTEQSDANQATGILVEESDYITVRNNYVHDCGCDGIGIAQSDYLTITENVTARNGRYSDNNCSGIAVRDLQAADEAEGVHVLLAQNVAFSNEAPTEEGNGIVVVGSSEYAAAVTIENNLSFLNGGAGLKTDGVTNFQLRNNTTYHNTTGILLNSVTGTAGVYNNLVVAMASDGSEAVATQVADGATLRMVTNHLVGTNTFNGTQPETEGDVLREASEQDYAAFGAPASAGDMNNFQFGSRDDFKLMFGLLEGSPAIDAGTTDLGPSVDLVGESRPVGSGIDVGAFEGVVEAGGPATPPNDDVVSINKLQEELTVDGVADDAYSSIDAIAMANEVQPGITDASDLSGNWRALWTETGLYVFIDVTDDVLVNDSDLWYQDDGIEIFIDGGNEKAGSYDNNDYQFSVQYGVDELVAVSDNKPGAGAEAVVVDREGGYSVEAFIPWSALNVTPALGMQLGLDAHIFDDDNGGDELQGKLAWTAQVDESYLNPGLFGTVELDDALGLRTPVAIGDWLSVYPNPTSGQLRYDLGSSREANLQLRDANGRLVLEQRANSRGGTLELGTLPNGLYLLTVYDGKEWARQRLIVQH